MYEGKNDSFSLKDIIFNLLFILLFVFILLWLFPSKSFLNDNKKKNNATDNQVFSNNMNTMKEAAITYFTTPRLPKKIGDNIMMTLKQMRDKKLLLPLIDKNGDKCDEGVSYIEITKEKDEYILKVTLSCGSEEEYILVHLGCYDYCDGDVCEKKEDNYKYQYKLEIPCKLNDWNNWSEWSVNYVAPNANKKVETKIENLTQKAILQSVCPAGYLYNNENKRCYKSVDSIDEQKALENLSFTCEAGFTFDETTKTCKKDITKIIIEPIKTNTLTYNCDKYSGFTINGDKCVKNESYIDHTSVIPTYTSYCAKGTLSSDKKTCSYSYTVMDSVAPGRKCSDKLVEVCTVNGCKDEIRTSCYRTCPGGYKIIGSTCQSPMTKWQTDNALKKVSGSSCPLGYDMKNGNSCDKIINKLIENPATPNPIIPYCEKPEFKLDETKTKCIFKQTDQIVIEPKKEITYSCDKYGKDYSLDIERKVCKKVVVGNEYKDLINTLNCPTGYKLNGNMCSTNIIKYRFMERLCTGGSITYKWSEFEKDEELLKLGYILTGKKEKIEIK